MHAVCKHLALLSTLLLQVRAAANTSSLPFLAVFFLQQILKDAATWLGYSYLYVLSTLFLVCWPLISLSFHSSAF